ncbi:unnamed protein product [Didymodactylos carnosus]|uniref:Uncharacterized protein n=1 Tax=Didymodactylos carnosus TaxID=1234261 RepID=A0A8S2EVN0_9BILA|nr:unnamed protein product [Didymodactylos carnosus]CAF4074254.1 unnamed protein product [Didymodactylos carnosus]
MYPKESCSCRAKQICIHRDAVHLSLNRSLDNDSITLPKTIKTKSASGNKKPRKADKSRDKSQLDALRQPNPKKKPKPLLSSKQHDLSSSSLASQLTKRRNIRSYDILADTTDGGQVVEQLKHFNIYEVDLDSLTKTGMAVTDGIIDACLTLLKQKLNSSSTTTNNNNNNQLVQLIGETRVALQLESSPFMDGVPIDLITGVLAEPGHFVAFTCTDKVLSVYNSLYPGKVTTTEWQAVLHIPILAELQLGHGYSTSITFDENKLRSHTFLCLEQNEIKPYPKTSKNCVRKPKTRLIKIPK